MLFLVFFNVNCVLIRSKNSPQASAPKTTNPIDILALETSINVNHMITFFLTQFPSLNSLRICDLISGSG